MYRNLTSYGQGRLDTYETGQGRALIIDAGSQQHNTQKRKKNTPQQQAAAATYGIGGVATRKPWPSRNHDVRDQATLGSAALSWSRLSSRLSSSSPAERKYMKVRQNWIRYRPTAILRD